MPPPPTLLLEHSRGVRVESGVDKQIIGLSYKCHSNGYNIDVPGRLIVIFISINGKSEVTIKI